jgi:hypothetical protein
MGWYARNSCSEGQKKSADKASRAASGGSCQKREWLLLGPRWGEDETHPCVTAARVIPRRVGPTTGLAKSLAHGGRHQVGVSSSQKRTKQNTDWRTVGRSRILLNASHRSHKKRSLCVAKRQGAASRGWPRRLQRAACRASRT